jgi:hypothetical protein
MYDILLTATATADIDNCVDTVCFSDAAISPIWSHDDFATYCKNKDYCYFQPDFDLNRYSYFFWGHNCDCFRLHPICGWILHWFTNYYYNSKSSSILIFTLHVSPALMVPSTPPQSNPCHHLPFQALSTLLYPPTHPQPQNP